MVHRASVAALIVCVVPSLFLACQSKQLPHSGEEPAYPLRGLHAAVPCVGCHGPGVPEQLPVLCIACHEADRPEPDHFLGQACIDCHVEDGWGIVETTTPTLPTGGTPFPKKDHAKLDPGTLCWECHEKERSAPDHYADPASVLKPDPITSDDCAGCHTATAWYWEPIEHPVRIPHGTGTGAVPGESCDQVRPEDQWESTCEGCHPNGTDTYVCFACHNEDAVPGELVHDGTWGENQCMGCHVDAESTECP